MNYLESITLILKQEGFCLSGLDSVNDPINIQNLITAFKSEENQQRLVVQIGQSRNVRFFDFLEYCIFNAANENITQGTLKYLHY
jgi:hypothetical protein